MMRRGDRQRGFTLAELMVAMTIFSLMGLFLFNLMARSLEIYRGSSQSAESYDKFDTLTQRIEEDLRCVWIGDPEGSGPKSAFLLSHDRQYVPSEDAEDPQLELEQNAWPAQDPRSFALRFVRTFPGGELNSTVGRFAGTYAEQDAYIDGANDELESRADEFNRKSRDGQSQEARSPSGSRAATPSGLKAPRGLMEVLYFLDRADGDPEGSYTLFRAVRSPIGGAGSLVAPGFLGRMTPEWIEEHAIPVVSGIAHLGVLAWSQNTRAWQREESMDLSWSREDGVHDGAENWWDSRRSTYERFSLHRGTGSARVYEDDVFPESIQVVMTFMREGNAEVSGRLLQGVGVNQRRFSVSNAKPFQDVERGGRVQLRVGEEWMNVLGADGRELEVSRGIRRTAATNHDSGSVVVIGRRFAKVIDIPAFRSDYSAGGRSR